MSDAREALARVLGEHQPTSGMSVTSGVTCRCGYWNGNEQPGVTRPVGLSGLIWHQGEVVLAWLADNGWRGPGETVTTAEGLAALPVRSVLARLHDDGSGPSVYLLDRDTGWLIATEPINQPIVYPSGRDQVGNRVAPLTVLYRPEPTERGEE